MTYEEYYDYEDYDESRDEFYEEISRELYKEHKKQAIGEFTSDRLRSFYILKPDVMRPAVDALQEGKELRKLGRHSPALVFFVSSIELLLKATLLKPVVYGLIHNEPLANIVVQHSLGQTGFNRYEKLLAELFTRLASMDIKGISREGTNEKLLKEAEQLQELRNDIIHKGACCSEADTERAYLVAVAVYELIVTPMLNNLGLTVEKGIIKPV
jgi:hypothetical protein